MIRMKTASLKSAFTGNQFGVAAPEPKNQVSVAAKLRRAFARASNAIRSVASRVSAAKPAKTATIACVPATGLGHAPPGAARSRERPFAGGMPQPAPAKPARRDAGSGDLIGRIDMRHRPLPATPVQIDFDRTVEPLRQAYDQAQALKASTHYVNVSHPPPDVAPRRSIKQSETLLKGEQANAPLRAPNASDGPQRPTPLPRSVFFSAGAVKPRVPPKPEGLSARHQALAKPSASRENATPAHGLIGPPKPPRTFAHDTAQTLAAPG